MELLHEETPAYKLNLKGTHGLTDVDLLALVIAAGETTKAATAATTLARKILGTTSHGLHELGKLSLTELVALGCTELQANKVVAMWELGRRRQLSDIRDKPRISSSRDAFNCIATALVDKPHEEFWVMYITRANQCFKREQLSIGGASGTVVDMKLLFKGALAHGAHALIMVHNHPSGNLEPSRADIELTEKAKQIGRNLDMPVLDHLIVSERGYYSFADEGMI